MSSPVAGKSVASTAIRPARVIRLNSADDVVIALDQLMSGTVLNGEAVTVLYQFAASRDYDPWQVLECRRPADLLRRDPRSSDHA